MISNNLRKIASFLIKSADFPEKDFREILKENFYPDQVIDLIIDMLKKAKITKDQAITVLENCAINGYNIKQIEDLIENLETVNLYQPDIVKDPEFLLDKKIGGDNLDKFKNDLLLFLDSDNKYQEFIISFNVPIEKFIIGISKIKGFLGSNGINIEFISMISQELTYKQNTLRERKNISIRQRGRIETRMQSIIIDIYNTIIQKKYKIKKIIINKDEFLKIIPNINILTKLEKKLNSIKK